MNQWATLKVAGHPADAPAMSVDRAPQVAYLESARAERAESPAGQIEVLRRTLDTERSAGKAMLVTLLDLEQRLVTERRTGQALLATVRDLQGATGEEQNLLREKRLENERLWVDIHGLEAALREAERPLWRKLLRRS